MVGPSCDSLETGVSKDGPCKILIRCARLLKGWKAPSCPAGFNALQSGLRLDHKLLMESKIVLYLNRLKGHVKVIKKSILCGWSIGGPVRRALCHLCLPRLQTVRQLPTGWQPDRIRRHDRDGKRFQWLFPNLASSGVIRVYFASFIFIFSERGRLGGAVSVKLPAK